MVSSEILWNTCFVYQGHVVKFEEVLLYIHFFYRTPLVDGYCQMTTTLKIDAEILKSSTPLHYKYTVFSPKVEKEDDWYEYLHDYPGMTNRFLIIPTDKYCQLADQGLLLL